MDKNKTPSGYHYFESIRFAAIGTHTPEINIGQLYKEKEYELEQAKRIADNERRNYEMSKKIPFFNFTREQNRTFSIDKKVMLAYRDFMSIIKEEDIDKFEYSRDDWMDHIWEHIKEDVQRLELDITRDNLGNKDASSGIRHLMMDLCANRDDFNCKKYSAFTIYEKSDHTNGREHFYRKYFSEITDKEERTEAIKKYNSEVKKTWRIYIKKTNLITAIRNIRIHGVPSYCKRSLFKK